MHYNECSCNLGSKCDERFGQKCDKTGYLLTRPISLGYIGDNPSIGIVLYRHWTRSSLVRLFFFSILLYIFVWSLYPYMDWIDHDNIIKVNDLCEILHVRLKYIFSFECHLFQKLWKQKMTVLYKLLVIATIKLMACATEETHIGRYRLVEMNR